MDRGTDAGVANKVNEDTVVVDRDSKNSDQTVLVFTPAEWGAFVTGVKAGEFDTNRLIEQAFRPAAG